MKLLGMVSLVDMRIVDMTSESGTYSTMKKIIKRLIETQKLKQRPNIQVEILGKQILKEIKNLNFGESESHKELQLLTYLKSFTKDELNRRMIEVASLVQYAEILKVNINAVHQVLSE